MNQRYLALVVNRAVFSYSLGMLDFKEDCVIDKIKEACHKNKTIVFVSRDEKTPIIEGDVGVFVTIDQFLSSPFEADCKLAYKAGRSVKLYDVKVDEQGIYTCKATPLIYEECDMPTLNALFEKAKVLYEEYSKSLGLRDIPLRFDSMNSDLDNIMAKLGSVDRFRFVNSKSTERRLLYFIKAITEAKERNDIDETVASKVKEAMDLSQREYYVREQIRALSQEIDEDDETEAYLDKIDALNACDEIKDKLRKETRKLRRLAPSSPDQALIKNYLDTVLDLPWGVYTEDCENLSNAEDVLNQDHYGLEKVKERLIEALAVRKLSKEGRSPIICLVGPPGIGKTSIARSIAKAMNKNYVRLSFGGVRDEAEIRGHRKTYIGAMPGRIITSIKAAGSMNPLFLMDEIDKMASDYKGDPASALLEVLDPEQNVNFRDHFVEMPFDLSKVLFITTANTLDTISQPLLDRMEIIEMSGYTSHEKIEIAKRHLITKAIKQNGISREWVVIDDVAIENIIELYTRESGVRSLEKRINAIMRKVARAFVDNPNADKHLVTKDNLSFYLGEPKYLDKSSQKEDQVGVVTGLAWTAVGGDTLAIEVMITPGKGDTVLTGNLGTVMQESAKIAISYCRNMSNELGLSEDFFKKNDIHIHVPEGATPKDGPSAGITIATALFSVLSNKKVDHRIAMTGELTLRGNVLPIGGLKEKSLAAVRAGVKKIFLPEDNRKDYKELPELVKKKLEFVFVNNVKNVISGALI